MKTIGQFELVDHGIEHFQYFQGCGITFTDFRNVATGIGDNPAEAIDDCLDQISQNNIDTEGMEARIMVKEKWNTIPKTPSVEGEYEWFNHYYHVSIRYNEETHA